MPSTAGISVRQAIRANPLAHCGRGPEHRDAGEGGARPPSPSALRASTLIRFAAQAREERERCMRSAAVAFATTSSKSHTVMNNHNPARAAVAFVRELVAIVPPQAPP